MKIFYSGEPRDKETEAKVKAIIDDFEYEDHEYIIGIDYAPKDSKDFTAVARCRKNEDGTTTLENVEYI